MAASLAGAGLATAHPDGRARLRHVDRALEQAPESVEALVTRACLRFHGGDLRGALADFARARRSPLRGHEAEVLEARALREGGLVDEALRLLDDRLLREPRDLTALLERARCRHRAGRPRQALQDYERIVSLARAGSGPAPEVWLERAELTFALGGPHRVQAIAGLDQGLRRLGPVPGLLHAVIDLELTAGRPAEALRRIDERIAASSRPDLWLIRRGQVLQDCGRPADAAASYDDAWLAHSRLKSTGRRVPGSQRTEATIRAALRDLSAPAQEESTP
jgi:tetratricopeptide (TPR) repeat protein